MPYFTTGLLDSISVKGAEQGPTLSVNLLNDDSSTVAIQIEGFSHSGTTKVKYVEEFFTLAAGSVVLKNYYIPFNAFEFIFFISSQSVDISVWTKDVKGSLTTVPLEVSDANV